MEVKWDMFEEGVMKFVDLFVMVEFNVKIEFLIIIERFMVL